MPWEVNLSAQGARKRVRWACRRGMLELDLFLLPFFDHCYDNLPLEEKKDFALLLSQTDPQLFAWLMQSARPEKKELASIVDKIRVFQCTYR